MNKVLIAAALAGVFATGVAASAQAADSVKCYGIAKAGKNDCKASDGSHACKGYATKDNSPVEWVHVADKAACDAAKGSTEAPKN
jgi:uncharacterized membrane protein